MTTVGRDDESVVWLGPRYGIGPATSEQRRRIAQTMRWLARREALRNANQAAAVGAGEAGPRPDVSPTAALNGGDDLIQWHRASRWGDLQPSDEQPTHEHKRQ